MKYLCCFGLCALGYLLTTPSFSQSNPIRYSCKLPPAGWIRQTIFEDEIVVELPYEFKKVPKSLMVREYPFDAGEIASFHNGSTELTLYKTNQNFPIDESGLKLWHLIESSFPCDEPIESGYVHVNGILMYYLKSLSIERNFNIRLFAEHHGKLFHANVEARAMDSRSADRIFEHLVSSLRFL